MFIVNNRKYFFGFTILLSVLSIFSIYYYGFNFGIDFRGGSLLEVSYESERLPIEEVRNNLNSLDIGSYSLSPSGNSNYILKAKDLNPDEKEIVMSAFSEGDVLAKEERFNSIGPVVGNQLKEKAMIAIAVVVVCIVIFITFAFRKVSAPVASWKYGLVTIVTLIHDVLIPTGVFVAWNHFRGGEIDLLFVTALLAILGYSVHDTIVVFDRVRENLRITNGSTPFTEVVGDSVIQTMARSINTSLTTLLVLVALYFIGGETTKDFSFVLLVGILTGAYSSVFLAAPLLVTLEQLQKKS